MRTQRSCSIALATLMLILTPLACGSTSPQSAQQAERVGPKAVAPTTVKDLGKHARGTKVRTEFEIHNEGDAPLQILDTASSCACLIVETPADIAPGAKGALVAEIDTEVLEGPSRAVASVLTNDRATPTIKFTVNVESVPYLAAKPGYFRYLVHQGFDEEAAISTTVVATEPPQFTIQRVEATSPHIAVEFREAEPSERLAGFEGPQYRVTAKLDKNAEIGPLTGFVRVHTDHEKQKMFSIPVSGFVRPVVAVTPPRIDLGTFSVPDVEEERVLLAEVRVQHFLEQASQLSISKIETDIPNLQSTIRDGDSDRDWYVALWWPKEKVPTGEFAGTVTIHTTSERAPKVELPVKGERQG